MAIQNAVVIANGAFSQIQTADELGSAVIALEETTAPLNTAGYGKLYVKSADSKLYFKNDSGAEFDLTASGFSGSGTVNHIAYFDGASSVASEALGELYWDPTNNRLGLNTSSPAFDVDLNRSVDGAIRVHIQNDNVGTSTQALFEADNGTSKIQFGIAGTGFAGSAVYGADQGYVQCNGNDLFLSASGGTATGVYIHSDPGVGLPLERIGVNGDGELVINEPGENYNFRVEGDTNTNLIFADAGLDEVGIGTGTPNEILTVEGAISLDEISAPLATIGYGKIYVKSSDSLPYFKDSSGTESPLVGGGTGTVNHIAYFNTTSTVSSESGGELYWDSTNNRLGLHTSTPAYDVDIDRSVNSAIRQQVKNDNAGTSAQALYQASNGSSLIQFGISGTGFTGSAAYPADSAYVQANGTDLYLSASSGTAANVFILTDTGVPLPIQRLSAYGTGELVINDPGENYDFRVEGDTDTHLLFADASTDRVGIGTATPEKTLHVTASNDVSTIIERSGTATNTNNSPLQVTHKTSLDMVSGFGVYISLNAEDNLGNFQLGRVGAVRTNADTQSELQFWAKNGTDVLLMSMNGDEVIVNENGDPRDFRVESNSDTHALFVDGSADNVGISEPSPSAKLHVSGDMRVQTTGNANSIYVNNTDGHVGLGTVSPIYLLHVSPGDAPAAMIERTGSTTTGSKAPLVVKATTTANMVDDFGVYISLNVEDSSAVNNQLARIGAVRFGADNTGEIELRAQQLGASRLLMSLNPTEVVVNENSDDRDFRVESNFNTHMLFVDGTNDRLGVGLSSPNEVLTVEGAISLDEITAPAATAGYGKIYVKSTDSKLYYKDDSGTEFDLTAGASGVTGSGTANRIAYFDSASSITSEAGAELVWDPTLNHLGVGIAAPTYALHVFDTSVPATLERSNVTNNVTSSLNLKKSTAGVMADGFGPGLSFVVEDGTSGENAIAVVAGVRDGADDTGFLRFQAGTGATTNVMWVYGTEVVVNEESSATVDFRVETDGNTHGLFVDASANAVGVNVAAPSSSLHVDGDFRVNANGNAEAFYINDTTANVGVGTASPVANLHVSVDGNVPAAALTTTDAFVASGQSTAPGVAVVAAGALASNRGVFKGVRSDGTLAAPTAPAVDDYVMSFLGAIYDGTNTEGTAAIDFYVDGAVSLGVAPQRISFVTSATNAAGRTERMQIASSGNVTVNPNHTAADFSVYSDSATDPAIFVDGSANLVGVYTDTPEFGLHVQTSGAFERVTGSTSLLAEILTLKQTTTGAMVDGFGTGVKFTLEDSAAVANTVGVIYVERDGADTTGKMTFRAGNNGNTLGLSVTGTEVIVNDGAANMDFRVEGEAQTHLLYADASIDSGEGRVMMGTSAGVERLSVNGRIQLFETTQPGFATAGTAKLYASSTDGLLYYVDGSGNHHKLVTSTTAGTANRVAFFDGSGLLTSETGSEFYWDSTNNYLGLGTDTPDASIHISTGDADLAAALFDGSDSIYIDDARRIALLSTSTTASSASAMRGLRSRGTPDTPTAVVNGDRVFTFLGGGFDGTSIQHTALIEFNVNGAVSAGNVPQEITFVTSASSAGLRAERMTVTPSGPIHIHDAGSSSTPALYFNDDTNSGIYQNAVDQVNVSTGGTERLRISNGFVQVIGGSVMGIPNGTVSAPTLVFNADTNTGIWAPAADQLAISAGGAERIRFASNSVVINQDAADVDFRVESSGNDHMIAVDGGNNRVGIGTNSSNEMLTVGGVVSLLETTAPTLTASHGKIYVKSTDSKLYFLNDSGTEFDLTAAAPTGTANHVAFFSTSSSITSESSGELYWDDTNNRLGVNNSAPDYTVDIEHTNIPLRSKRTTANTNTFHEAMQVMAETSGAMADGFGSAIGFGVRDSGLADNTIAFVAALRDGADGTGLLRFSVGSSGTVESLRLKSTEAVFNESAVAGMNFRAESDNETHAFFIQGSTDRVAVGTSSPQRQFHANATSSEPAARMQRNEGTSAAHSVLELVADNSVAITNDFGAMIDFLHGDNLQAPTSVGRFGTERYNADNSGRFVFYPVNAGTEVEAMEVRTDQVTINPIGVLGDVDFRIFDGSGNTLVHADGGNAQVGIGTSTTNEKLTVEGVLSLDHQAAPAGTAGYGKVYAKSDDTLHFVDDNGNDNQLMYAQRPLISLTTANVTLNVVDSGSIIANTSSTATRTVTLPSAEAGLYFDFFVDHGTNDIVVSINTGDVLRNGPADATTSGGSITSSTSAGSTLSIVCISTGTWMVTASNGTWTTA